MIRDAHKYIQKYFVTNFKYLHFLPACFYSYTMLKQISPLALFMGNFQGVVF